MVYARVFFNRSPAEAYRRVFHVINDIVTRDTGSGLVFRHLHAQHPTELTGILTFTLDQGGDQAKGLGLFLSDISPLGKYDLHERSKLLSQLGPYDHLRRLARLCAAHFHRNVTSNAAPPAVKAAMRSLHCLHHPDYDGTLSFIDSSGTAGRSECHLGDSIYVTDISIFEFIRLATKQSPESVCAAGNLVVPKFNSNRCMESCRWHNQHL